MPTGSIVQLVCGIIALALVWTTWWMKRNDSRIKERDEEDKRIDATDNADDVLIELDRLRNKRTSSP